MKYRKGFAPVLLWVVLGLGVAGGAYALYQNHQDKRAAEIVQQETEAQIAADARAAEAAKTAKTTRATTSVSTPSQPAINCGDDFACIASAAKECKAAIGVASFADIEMPFIEGLLATGRTRYEIKKTKTSCSMSYASLAMTLSLSAEGRAALREEDITDAQIDEQLTLMNQSYAMVAGKTFSCTGTGTALADYVTEQVKGSSELHFEANVDSNSAQTVITTASGEKVTCTE